MFDLLGSIIPIEVAIAVVAFVFVLVRVTWDKPRETENASPPLMPPPSNKALELTRERILFLVRREITRAFLASRIQRSSYDDVEQYLEKEQRELSGNTHSAAAPRTDSAAMPANMDAALRPAANSEHQPEGPVEIPPLPILQKIMAQEPEISLSERKEESTSPLAGAAPHAVPVQPAFEKPPEKEAIMAEHRAPMPKDEGVIVKPRSWAERFFTPENVRILQSLGIGIIFLSAVAFVRSEMWNGATVWSQMGMLLAGTVCCSGLGILLLRKSQMRLTGLCFLILGQLSLLVDLYALRIFHSPSGEPLYTHSYASLWTIGFAVFALTAYVQARITKESLFEAFTYFGALAAWGAGMLWLNTSAYLLPASFVPVLLASSWIARGITQGQPSRRWTLPWWLSSGVTLSAPLFCAVLPVAALVGGTGELAHDFHWHALAIFALAIALLRDAYTERKARPAHAASILLLMLAPLGVYAFQDESRLLEHMSTAFALPGLLLASAGMLLGMKYSEHRKGFLDPLANWGTVSVVWGMILSLTVSFSVQWNDLVIMTLGAAFLTMLLRALVLREKWAPWLATFAATYALVRISVNAKFDVENLALIFLLLASGLRAGWYCARRNVPGCEAVTAHGGYAADVLAILIALLLSAATLFGSSALHVGMHAAWYVLAAYMLLTSLVRERPIRRCMGIVLLGLAIVPPQFLKGAVEPLSVMVLAVASVGAMGLSLLLNRRERNASLLKAGLIGSGLMVPYGTLMALQRVSQEASLGGGVSLVLLAGSLCVLATLIRTRLQGLSRASLLETLALLELAVGLAVLANFIGVDGTQWPLALAMISVLVLLAGMALEALSGVSFDATATTGPTAFLESRAAAVAMLGGLALLISIGDHAFDLPRLDMSWRTFLSVSLLTLYFSFATSTKDLVKNSTVRWFAAAASYWVLVPATYLLFLKAHSTGSSWGAVWFLMLAPVMLTAAYLMRRENEIEQSNAAFVGAGFVSLGALVMAFATNHGNVAGVPCATMLGIGVLAIFVRRILKNAEFTTVACAAFTSAAFYGLRAACGEAAWSLEAPNVWEMPAMLGLGMATLIVGSWKTVEPLPAPRENESLVAWFGLVVSIGAVVVAGFLTMLFGAHVSGGGLGNTGRLDALIVSIAMLAPAFLIARRTLALKGGRHWASACAGLAYVLQVWKAHPVAWEWYTLPPAVFLFLWAWELAREEKVEGAVEINGLLGLGSALALLPSFIQGLPWNGSDLWHVLTLAVVGFGMIFTALATRRKVPLLSASGTILCCLMVHAIHLAMHRQLMLPVGGLIAGFSVLGVASLFESRMNQNLRTAVDRAKAEARMFWTSWN